MKPGKVKRSLRQAGPDAKALFDTWISGYESRDVNKVMSVFDSSIRYSAHCQPEQDFESLSSWFKNDFGRGGLLPSWSYVIESQEPGSDLTVIVSLWTSVTHYEGFSADIRRLRSIDFLRPCSGGWKIVRTINDPQPCGPSLKAVRKSRPR